MTLLPQKSYYQVALFMNAKPLKPSLVEYVVLRNETKNSKEKKTKLFPPLVSSKPVVHEKNAGTKSPVNHNVHSLCN